MSKGTLFDYTTLISAANVLNCQAARHPQEARNPYASLISGKGLEPESPAWIEIACLANVVESIVIQNKLWIVDAIKLDRIFDVSSPLIESLKSAEVLDVVHLTERHSENLRAWIRDAINGQELLPTLLRSFFELLVTKPYNTLPDLFSYSQTVYVFDGETMWRELVKSLELRSFTEHYKAERRRLGFSPRLNYTNHLFAEEILAFFARGMFYNELAKVEGVPYSPHPGRSAIVLSDPFWSAGLTLKYGQAPIEFISGVRDEVIKERMMGQAVSMFALHLPPIFTAVLREAQAPEQIIEVALQIRDSKPARAFREWLDVTFRSESGLAVLDAQKELKELHNSMRAEFALDKEEVQVKLWMFSFNVKVPWWLKAPIYLRPRRHLQFVRELTRAVLDVLTLERELVRIFRSS